jgi:hypothetical protein
MKFLDEDMRNFSGFYLLLFAAVAALVIFSITHVIVYGS